MRFGLVAGLLALVPLLARADVPPALKAIEAKYNEAKVSTDEPTRIRYEHDLSDLYLQLKAKQDWSGLKEVNAQLALHPAREADADLLQKKLIGEWQGSQHGRIYKADGTWVLSAGEKSPVHGIWRVEGNQFMDTYSDTNRTVSLTILLVDDRYFDLTDGNGRVFVLTRVASSKK